MSSDDQADTEAVYIANSKVTASPVAGTFTLTYRHGVSDPMPYTASGEVMMRAAIQAGDRDYVIEREHLNNPVTRAACPVCTPPPPEAKRYRKWRWYERFGYAVYASGHTFWRTLREDRFWKARR